MVKRVADGSFGLVYLMRNKKTQDQVAAKRIKHRKPEDVYFSRKEFHILNKIRDGAGVVALIDYFESPAQSVIITEYLEGGTFFCQTPVHSFEHFNFLLEGNVDLDVECELQAKLRFNFNQGFVCLTPFEKNSTLCASR